MVVPGLHERIKTKLHARPDNDHYPPLCVTIPDLSSCVVPMLHALGPHASQDPVLLYKLLRICKTGLGIKESHKYDNESSSEIIDPEVNSSLYYLTITLMDEVFLPSLSLLTSNCCLAEEIWFVVKYFPIN